MPDPAIVATGGGVLATVVASFASFLDVRSLKARVDTLEAVIITGLSKRIDEAVAAIDPKLRGDLNTLSARVTRYRNEPIPTTYARMPTGSMPQVDERSAEAMTALNRRLDELAGMLAAALARITANEESLLDQAKTAGDTRDIVIAVRATVEMLRDDRKRG